MCRAAMILALFFTSFWLLGQSEDCSTEPSMIGQMLPINTLVSPQSDDFDMTGMGCEPFDTSPCGFQNGFDVVVCFTPSNDCTVVYQVATGSTNVALHVFRGDCMEPLECIVSDNTDTMSGIILERGVQYCFVAERCGTATANVFIGDAGTDCGLLIAPDLPWRFCVEVIANWNERQLSSCTGLNYYTILDAIAFLGGDCPCDFPL